MQDFLKTAKDNGATHITISGYCYDDGIDNVDIQPVSVKTESDEDYAKRAEEVESRRLAEDNARNARGKALYEELKLIYGC